MGRSVPVCTHRQLLVHLDALGCQLWHHPTDAAARLQQLELLVHDQVEGHKLKQGLRVEANDACQGGAHVRLFTLLQLFLLCCLVVAPLNLLLLRLATLLLSLVPLLPLLCLLLLFSCLLYVCRCRQLISVGCERCG